MADLSNLLGAVYGEGSPSDKRDPDGPPVPAEPAAGERGPAVPDWADDEHLDAAFEQWKPGPPDDAPVAEREALDGPEPGPTRPLDDDLAAALSAALVEHHDDGNDTELEHDEHPRPHDDQSHLSSFTPQRAAAVELAAASRVDPEPEPAKPEPSAPSSPFSAAAAPTPVLAKPEPEPSPAELQVARTWDRSDDDILPTKSKGRPAKAPKSEKSDTADKGSKSGKGFFSLSLRRG